MGYAEAVVVSGWDLEDGGMDPFVLECAQASLVNECRKTRLREARLGRKDVAGTFE